MTKWRKRKAQIELAEHAKGYRRVDEMFRCAAGASVQNHAEEEGLTEEKELAVMAEKLSVELGKIKNQQSALAGIGAYQLQRLLTLQRYMSLLLEGKKKMEASKMAAEARWVSTSEWACRCIRSWAKTFLQLGHLPEHRQGRHSKRESLLDDQDIKTRCLEWLRATAPKDRSPGSLRLELETEILPDKMGEKVTLSESTVGRYMKAWGYQKRRNTQQVSSDAALPG